MKRIILGILVAAALAVPVKSMEFEAPEAPAQVRAAVEEPAASFGEGLWNVLRRGIETLDGSLSQAAGCCLTVCAAVLAGGIVRQLGMSGFSLELLCTVTVAAALLKPSAALLREGEETILQMNDYGKLLLPVMTGALAAEGGMSSSAALYTATAAFNSLLSAAATRLLLPVCHLYLLLSTAYSAAGEEILGKMRELLRWLTGWVLKLTLYLFTGFLAVTGVVSGTADAAALKAARLAVTGAVPVVGSILSDATEAVLVSAGVMRSAAGIYGVLTILALCIGPFLRIGVQYLLLRSTAALCLSLDRGRASALIEDFSAALGMLLAMIGTQGVLILISTVCFMKGVS